MKNKLLSMGLFFIMITLLTGCGAGDAEYKDGKKSFQSGNYEEASELFQAAIAENPDRADYYIDYGMTLIALKKYKEAIAQFDLVYMDKEILKVKENNKRLLRGKGIAYYHMLDFENAVKRFEEAISITELSGLDMDILNYMGSALMTVGDYEKAIETFTTMLSLDGKNAKAYENRALCYRNLGTYDKSLADYDNAIAIDPEDYDAYFGKYYLMTDNGYESDAEEILTLAEKIEVKTDEDSYNLAKVHYYRKNYELALEELNLGFANGFTEAYYFIGEIYRIEKDYQKAVFFYEKFINEGEIVTPNVYNQIASCQIKAGDYKKAIENLKTGISYHHAGTLQVMMKNEIVAYECLGDFTAARDKMEEYLKSYPEDADAKREADFIRTRLIDITQEASRTEE